MGKHQFQPFSCSYGQKILCRMYKLICRTMLPNFFFAYRPSLVLLEVYSEVPLIDYIYKINCYHMPLCNIVGITGVNITFIIVMAFLKQEHQCNYSWVLKQLKNSTTQFTPTSVIVTD